MKVYVVLKQFDVYTDIEVDSVFAYEDLADNRVETIEEDACWRAWVQESEMEE